MDDRAALPHEPMYRVGEWLVLPARCRLSRNGTDVPLTPRAMEVLVYLIERAGVAVTNEELLSAFWIAGVSSTNAVHKSIAELRQTFGDDRRQARYIETVHKRGYRLVASVEVVEKTSSERTGDGSPADVASNGTPSPDGNLQIAPPYARVIPGRGRAAVLLGSLALFALAVVWWVLRDPPLSARTITIGDQDAVFLPAEPGMLANDRRLVDAAIDKVVARCAALPDCRPGVRSLPSDLDVREAAAAVGTDYAVAITVSELGDQLVASVAMVPTDPGRIAHHEDLAQPGDYRGALAEDLARHLADDLAVLLDHARFEQMVEWGTRSVHAYLLAVEGDSFQAIPTMKSLREAEDRFLRALDEDPNFPYAFNSLGAVYQTMLPGSSSERESIRLKIQTLMRRAAVATVSPDVRSGLQLAYLEESISSPFEYEATTRQMLIENPSDFAVLHVYSVLLFGAKLLAEGEQYLAMAISAAPNEFRGQIESEYATVSQLKGDFNTGIYWNKRSMQINGEKPFLLFAIINKLSRVGKFPEAEDYLTRLKAADPIWGRGAELVLQVWRGDITKGSEELERALADPTVANVSRGTICFILGDIECGVRYWRKMEAVFARYMWLYGSSTERYFADGVVEDPRYQSLLEELGIGRTWRAYMRQKAAELTPVTGIAVTSPVPPEDAGFYGSDAGGGVKVLQAQPAPH